MIHRITEMAEAIAKVYRASVTVEELSSVPAVISDDGMTELMVHAVKELGNGMTLLPGLHAMGSEDFAFYCQQVPSVIVGLGAGVADKSKWVGQHNPKILFHEDILVNEVALYAKIAVDWLESNR